MLVAVAAVLCHKLSLSHVVSGAHTRSDVSVGAAVSYSVVSEHDLMAVHWRLLLVPAAIDSHWPCVHAGRRHVRSVVAVGG